MSLGSPQFGTASATRTKIDYLIYLSILIGYSLVRLPEAARLVLRVGPDSGTHFGDSETFVIRSGPWSR